MKSKYIFQKNYINILIITTVFLIIGSVALLCVWLVSGFEGMDEFDLLELHLIIICLPIAYVACFVISLGQCLKVNEKTVAKYKWFKKVQEINWSEVVSVEREVVRNGISKTENPTMTEIFVVLKLIDNTKMSFMYSNKGYNTLKTYFDNTRQTDKV